MPGFFDPFTPGATADPTAGVDPGTYDKIRQQWGTFMDDPHGRAALLSAGLALMQPPSFGDTGAGQIGRAIGAGGESATANLESDRKQRETDIRQQEADSKGELRVAQAGAAEARAGTAGARADAAGSRLDLQREQLKAMNERNLLGNRVRLSGMYQNYVKDVAKRNQDPLRTAPPDPVLPMNDWIKSNPMIASMGLVPPGAGTEGDNIDIPAVSPPTTTASPPKPMPNDRNQLQPGATYTTPKGVLKWTGTGFVPP